MKNKLLLFLVFHFLLAFTTEGKPTKRNTSPKSSVVTVHKKPTIYKYDPTPFFAPKKALLLLPPSVTGGSSCGPGSVTLTATVSSGETVEWFTSQNAATPIATGPTFTTPILTATTTYYVQAKSTTDTSTRVPVVAIIQNQPPSVSLSVTPASNSTNPICEGTSLTFTATGGGDVFEFSVDGTVRQAFSTNRTFTTTTITNNQTVTVRSRYAVTYDGIINENAWGTGSYEDNTQSAALSTNARNGYINSLRITPTEDKLVFGITGKLINYRRVLVFLDTKPGGFNVSNYGDENGSLPSVRAYNFFNNNPSTFDSYFEADYCLAIATDIGETNYHADIIELKNPNSIKTYLGTAATGVPSAVMGVNKNNTGITDYSNGFEIELLKSQLGYTGNDIKFFAFTMQDNSVSNYNVTNSFLSPELNKTADFGRNAVNYNNESPNPVIISATAMTPCYSSDSINIPIATTPTVATVGPNQSLCNLTSTPLGANTPLSGTGNWTLKSGPGTVSFANSTSPNSTATVSLPGTYVFTWTISNGQCQSSSADITAVFNLTNPPLATANQTYCKIDQPTVSNLMATGNAIQWFLNSTGGAALNSTTALTTQTYYAEQTDPATLCKSTTRTSVNVTVLDPSAPITNATQTFCNSAKISDLIATGTNVKWYLQSTGGIALDPTSDLTDGTYYASQTLNNTISCESTTRASTIVTITKTPAPSGSGNQLVCNSGTISNLVATGTSILWYANATGGSPLNPTTALVNGATYYASQTLSACESVNRLSVSVVINQPISPIIQNEESFCASENATITSLTNRVTNTNTVNWYLTPNSTTPLSVTDKLVNGAIYYGAAFTSTPLFCESSPRTTVKVNIESPSKPEGNSNQFFCNSSLPKIKDLVVTSGTNLKWYDNNNTLLSNDFALVDGGKYYATQTIGSCESVERFEVTVSILSPATPTTNANTQLFCIEQNPTLNSIAITKSNPLSNIKWYDSLTGGNLLPNDTALLNGNSYYAVEESINPIVCQSNNRLKVDIIIESAATPIVSSIEAPTCAKTTGSVILTGLPNGNWEIIPSSGASVFGTGATYKFENLSAGVSYNFKVKTANQCASQASIEAIIPVVPLYPNAATIDVTQPTCNLPFGKIEFTQQNGMEYSIGGNYQTSPLFDNLQPGKYQTSIRNSNSTTCMINTEEIVINPIPKTIAFELKSYCLENEFIVEIIPIDNSFSPNQVEITWMDKNQNSIGNDIKLNVTKSIGTIDDSIYPLELTAKVSNTTIGCETIQTISFSSVFCGTQKGISPDGNGSNEYFDLSTYAIKNISILNRYGVEVYHKKDYKNEWRGQTNDGAALPDGTYYYIITLNDETSKTGWIYVTRKQ
mgnify:CR=1 FL=1